MLVFPSLLFNSNYCKPSEPDKYDPTIAPGDCTPSTCEWCRSVNRGREYEINDMVVCDDCYDTLKENTNEEASD